jgi:hypothetical protein
MVDPYGNNTKMPDLNNVLSSRAEKSMVYSHRKDMWLNEKSRSPSFLN